MRNWIGALWAGAVSAAICYAEYLGLGAMLGAALLGYGAQSQAMGTLLIVLAASLSCLVLGLRRLPVIAGPRGASLSILVLGLLTLQSSFPVAGSGQLLIIVAMMLGCALALYMGTMRWVQGLFEQVPPWLIPAFIYGSAISIVASASHKYLAHCLRMHEWQTWGIFLSGTLAGLLWQHGCKVVAARTTHAPLAGLIRSLSGTSLIVGAGTAWLLYEFSHLPYGTAGMCARLGKLDLSWHSVTSRMALLAQQDWASLPLWGLLAAGVWGLFVGLVVLIETRTAVSTLVHTLAERHPDHPLQALHHPLMRWHAGTQALLAPATTIASSVSQARTLILWSLSRPSPAAVLCHAACLLAIAFAASGWLAWLPHISLVVLMTLVGCSMIVPALEKTWHQAYSLSHPGIAGGLGLWAVLAITALTGQALAGFVLPALVTIALHGWQCYRARRP